MPRSTGTRSTVDKKSSAVVTVEMSEIRESEENFSDIADKIIGFDSARTTLIGSFELCANELTLYK